MAHPSESAEAVDVRPADSDAAAVDAFERYLSDETEDGGVEEEPEPEADEGDEPESDEGEEEADDDEEPETPAIPAPVSFNADEKAVFATMTPEQQTAVAAIEARRNADVQKATTAAREAERNASMQAQGQVAQIQRQYANELAQYARAFEPQEPDYGLIATNPQEFAAQMAAYKQGQAHAGNLRKQSEDAQRQAAALEQQQNAQWEAEQQAILSREIPEWNDPAKRQELVTRLIDMGRGYGFEDEALSNVDARELIALHRMQADRDDAAKYRELVSKNMARVRSFKGKPPPVSSKPGVAQPKGSGQKRAIAETQARLKATGSDADAVAAFEAMGY